MLSSFTQLMFPMLLTWLCDLVCGFQVASPPSAQRVSRRTRCHPVLVHQTRSHGRFGMKPQTGSMVSNPKRFYLYVHSRGSTPPTRHPSTRRRSPLPDAQAQQAKRQGGLRPFEVYCRDALCVAGPLHAATDHLVIGPTPEKVHLVGTAWISVPNCTLV